MFGLLKRRAQAKGRIGIGFDGARIAIAVVTRDGHAVHLTRCEVLGVERTAGPAELAAALRSANLPRLPVSAVLQSADYQLTLVEAPDVPPAEMRAAMRWRLKDAIDFRVEEAVIDVFDVPTQHRAGPGRMLYAVAARRTAVDRWSNTLAAIGSFDVIDVPELCLRNLASIVPNGGGGVALLSLAEATATIILVRGQTFYFARQMDLEATLRTAAGRAAPANVDSSGIVLELQRSLDYYERHFDQPPITRIAISPDGPRAQSLADELSRDTGFDVSVLDLNRLMTCAEPIDPETQSACLLAVGAALREERRSL